MDHSDEANACDAIVVVAFYHLRDGVLTVTAAAAAYSRLNRRRLIA